MIATYSPFKKRVAWLVPAPIPGSGGHRTIINHASFLAEQGWETSFFVDTNDSPQEIKRTFEKLFYKAPITYRSGLTVDGNFSAVIATAWWTAISAARSEHIPNRLYFVQDYEPHFNPMGSNHLSAVDSYKLGLKPITIGRWLANKLQSDFGCQPQFFDFGVDHSTYFPIAGNRENAVCILYQDDKPRRCAEMITEAVHAIRFHRPDTKIYLYGQAAAPAISGTHHLGLLSRQQCNDLYNQCRVGICLSATNPSRIPFEMMASGLPVVDLHSENNLFEHVDETVLLSEPDPYSIAEAVLRILESPEEFQRRHEKCIEVTCRRSEQNEKSQFAAAFNNIVQGRKLVKLKLEPLYKAPAVKAGGRVPSKISSVHLKRLQHRLKDHVEPTIQLMRDEAAAALTAIRQISPREFSQKTIQELLGDGAVLSLDVWDTLIRRNVSPDEIKLRTAKFITSTYRDHIDKFYWQPLRMLALRRLCEKMIGEENEEAGRDDEYTIDDVFKRMYELAFLHKSQKSSEQFIYAMVNFEISQEISVSSVDEEIYRLLKNLKNRTILLSDFYMGKSYLSRILTGIGLDINNIQIFVSCDLGFSKRTGHLYPAVATHLGIMPESIIHIGDNEYSDVTQARNNGLRAIYYRPERPMSGALANYPSGLESSPDIPANLQRPSVLLISLG
ncbi:rhamnosyltransferase WsaF family glycosyltransferase [Phyllobacterium meliloti]|uniref:rhamnosyltransferase WsaF family glycosyltransferase n=1 Tax=Phyllobacterium meliloti TaxID=555317 RepID=UPI001F320A74|nr:glycosyltransferase [Phyllobacterium sp. T1293]UGX85542.1 glycosyltransferase [Phyllobacterium sp. T1293]